MRIDPNTWYDEAYFTGKKTYHDHNGEEQIYHGPSTAWEGFKAIRDNLNEALEEGLGYVMDLGCGGGDFVRKCREMGVPAYGLDISEYAVDNASNQDIAPYLAVADLLKITPEEIRDVFSADSFDTVTAFDVMEHLYVGDHARFLWLASSLVAFGGHLVFCIGATDNRDELILLDKDKDVPPEYEALAVAGHVTIAPFQWWCQLIGDCLDPREFEVDWEAMHYFQVLHVQDPRLYTSKAPWMQAWGSSRVIILKRIR